jgi:hypothetical protein
MAADLFAPDRFTHVTIHTWTGTRTVVVPDTTTTAQAAEANARSRAATGWPTHVTPGAVAGLASTVKRRRWFRRG